MFLLQMAGYPGSGKSTLSRKIAKRTGAIVIDRDIIKTSMINSKVPDSIVADASYSVVFDLAEFYLGMQISVVIDTPCFYEDTLNNGISISKKYGASYKYIECRVEDYSIIENRIYTRDRLISQIGDTSMERFNNALDKSVRPMNGKFLIIDTSAEDSYDISLIDEYLRNKI
ncbi:AAA family ATPase [Clostridium omnivorum]|uniref:ATP-binding protein n=1 Tax=Clostridium omnivorum TaxID=1604902 RepID=A0ABQ5N7Y3_9CLOT|nr:ATP-binding protein [Clostridium sp. E14]GLC31209.1 ATP-binding protein [Clostridium sp. E14]